MKYLFSYFLYLVGDIISRTTMIWFNGLGFNLYQKVMLWSCDLDIEGKIWKYPKKSKKKKKNDHFKRYI